MRNAPGTSGADPHSAQRVSDLEERVQRLEAEQAQFVHDWQHRPPPSARRPERTLAGTSWRCAAGITACKVAVSDAAMRVRDWFRRS